MIYKKLGAFIFFISLFVIFAMIFTPRTGILGFLYDFFEPETKTKLINSMGHYGIAALGIVGWNAIFPEKRSSNPVLIHIMAMWACFSLGFIAIDCEIFKNCGAHTLSTDIECNTEHDRQGAYIRCD